MRILFFIHALEGGGAESQLRHLSRGLAGRGFDVHVAFVDGDPGLLDQSGVVLHKLPAGSNYSFRSLLKVANLIRRLEPDLVQTWTLKFDVLVGICRWLLSFNWVVRESNSLVDQKPGLKDLLRVWLVRSADHVVANSPGGAAYWQGRGRMPVSVVENGYDMEFLDRIETDDGNVASPYLCYLGRLSLHKRVDRILAGLSLLDKKNISLEVIGDGVEAEPLKEMARQGSLPVNFHGYLSHVKALSLVKGSSVLLLLSDYEGTPNVVLEALYLGTPVILSDSESHKSFFPDDVALMVPSDDRHAVFAAMKEVLAGGDAVAARVKAGREFAEQWTVSRMVDRYIELYRGVVS